jgi:hypothetical protein
MVHRWFSPNNIDVGVKGKVQVQGVDSTQLLFLTGLHPG